MSGTHRLNFATFLAKLAFTRVAKDGLCQVGLPVFRVLFESPQEEAEAVNEKALGELASDGIQYIITTIQQRNSEVLRAYNKGGDCLHQDKYLSCLSKGDQNDNHDEPPRPTRVPDKAEATDVNIVASSISYEKPPKTDLWKEAYENLDKDRKALVSLGDTGSTTDAINGVIEQTQEKYTEWTKEGLKIRRKNGDDINIRDATTKILNAA
ncbi:hypothetical protein FE257_011417 [Aspergillus nanangensis]|uniref:Uncharacterized protein n=1 Tax=Aspergillus nanangensis TaxID=2582783 RepID=A0AAD4GRG0_ASPNN|nr:hypothetical protein FE257_011417 [Aspergillus nanangensis]